MITQKTAKWAKTFNLFREKTRETELTERQEHLKCLRKRLGKSHQSSSTDDAADQAAQPHGGTAWGGDVPLPLRNISFFEIQHLVYFRHTVYLFHSLHETYISFDDANTKLL